MNKQQASPNDELAVLAEAYRASVERLYSAIELAAIRQMAEYERNRNASKSNRARGRANNSPYIAR